MPSAPLAPLPPLHAADRDIPSGYDDPPVEPDTYLTPVVRHLAPVCSQHMDKGSEDWEIAVQGEKWFNFMPR